MNKIEEKKRQERAEQLLEKCRELLQSEKIPVSKELSG